MSITYVQVFLGRSWPRTLSGLIFSIFFQPTLATFCMTMPLELVGAEYPWQFVKLDPLQILLADLVLGSDTAHPVYHSPVITLQAMQIRQGLASDFVWSMALLTLLTNSSSGGDGKWVGNDEGYELIECAPVRHGIFWWKQVHNCELNMSSHQGWCFNLLPTPGDLRH